MIAPDKIKHLDKLFAKDERGEIPKRLTDEDYWRLAKEFPEDD